VTKRLTADDFFTGLFAALALKGEGSFSLRRTRFDEAVEKVYTDLVAHAPENDLEVRFRIYLHPVYGDSATIRDSVTRAAQRDIISFRNPEYQDIDLKLNRESAGLFLARLPASAGFFSALADRFLSSYRE
jgi:light-regulated signal transduction histidine kinase (bacteriophytochrome)